MIWKDVLLVISICFLLHFLISFNFVRWWDWCPEPKKEKRERVAGGGNAHLWILSKRFVKHEFTEEDTTYQSMCWQGNILFCYLCIFQLVQKLMFNSVTLRSFLVGIPGNVQWCYHVTSEYSCIYFTTCFPPLPYPLTLQLLISYYFKKTNIVYTSNSCVRQREWYFCSLRYRKHKKGVNWSHSDTQNQSLEFGVLAQYDTDSSFLKHYLGMG